MAAVRHAARGQTVLSSDIAEVSGAAGDVPPHVGLSPREFDVLRHLLEGAALDDIAERLSLSVKTVANYQTIIRQKLGVSNAVEMVRYAQQYGLMPG